MSTGADPLRFVLSSSVRSEVLRSVAGGSRTTDDLLQAVDASSSAVYDALGRLEEAGLLLADGEDWSLTGSGRLIADFVGKRARLESLLGDAGRYLSTHDTDAIPDRFRLRMSELADGRVITASETEPQGVVREVGDRLDRADSALVVTPIYDELFVEVMPESDNSRIVVDPEVVTSAAVELTDGESIEASLEDAVDYDVRVQECDFSLAVTDGSLMLSLPAIDGSYDTQSEFVAEHARARQWGRDLFEALWAEATPLSTHIAEADL